MRKSTLFSLVLLAMSLAGKAQAEDRIQLDEESAFLLFPKALIGKGIFSTMIVMSVGSEDEEFSSPGEMLLSVRGRYLEDFGGRLSFFPDSCPEIVEKRSCTPVVGFEILTEFEHYYMLELSSLSFQDGQIPSSIESASASVSKEGDQLLELRFVNAKRSLIKFSQLTSR